MDRQIIYPGSIPLDSDLLGAQRAAMVALGYLAQATLGTATCVDGLACTPQAVPNMTVNVGPGSIVSMSTVDGTAFGSLAADNTDALVKQGVNLTATMLTFSAPTTSGQSVNYLIEAAFQESDGTPVVLPYYNSANPTVPFSGPANAGTAQNTQRLQRVNLQVKSGTPATSGTQTTPPADSGFCGLWVVTLAYAQTAIVAGNISRAPGAPFTDAAGSGRGIQPGRLLAVRAFNTAGVTTYVPTPGTNSVEFEVQGAGGGGGGAVGAGSGNASSGTPGTSGAWGRGRATSGFAGVSITVGAHGNGGTGGAGTNGGTSSFGSLLSCPGGIGGSAGGAQSGSASGGNTNVVLPTGATLGFSVGSASSPSFGSTTGQIAVGGAGGRSMFGDGGSATSANNPGNSAVSPGSGGGGTIGTNNTGALTGGNGADGFVLIREFA